MENSAHTEKRRKLSSTELTSALGGFPIGLTTIIPAEEDRERLLGVIVAVNTLASEVTSTAAVEFTDGEVIDIQLRYALKHVDSSFPRVKVENGRIVMRSFVPSDIDDVDSVTVDDMLITSTSQ